MVSEELHKTIYGLNEIRKKDEALMRDTVVLVVGIHGAGKSRFLEILSSHFPKAFCTSGSELLRWESRGKRVTDISANQNRLIPIIQELRQAYKFIIFDGHLCILNHNNEYEFVGFEILTALAPSAIVLVQTDAHSIASRLVARDKYLDISVALLDEGIGMEYQLADRVAAHFNIPLYIIAN